MERFPDHLRKSVQEDEDFAAQEPEVQAIVTIAVMGLLCESVVGHEGREWTLSARKRGRKWRRDWRDGRN